MFSLVYRSVAKSSFTLDQIEDMLEKAKENNRILDITGCLLYHEGEFIQYLEGNQFKVLKLFDKIKADPRHRKVELLSHEQREERVFASWDMAYENFYGENALITHLKLMVGEYLEEGYVTEDNNPAGAVFWRTVGSILHARPTM